MGNTTFAACATLKTAHGEWAVEWPMHFDRPVDVRNAWLCHECARCVAVKA
jgi:hypothetical protein